MFSSRLVQSGLHFFLLVLLVSSHLGAVVQKSTSKTEEWLNKGTQLVAEGKFSQALAIFNRHKQDHPADPRPYFHIGVVLSGMGRLSGAASELAEAVRLDPARSEYRLYQASVLTDLKQKLLANQALATFDSQEKVDQLTIAWLWLLSDVYYRLERNDDALRILEQLSKLTPNDARIDLNRGQVYVVKGDHQLARKFFEKSIAKQPAENALAYFELGKVLHQQNQLPAAKKALTEAVNQRGTNPEYLHKLGAVCLALNQIDEAIVYLERAEPAGSAYPEIFYALGRAYRKKRDQARARHYLKQFQKTTSGAKAKEERDRQSGLLITEAEKELDRGNKPKARTLFGQALQIDPGNWTAHGYLAEMFLNSGDLQLAYSHLVKMEEIEPDSPVGNYHMATYWYRMHAFDRARQYAEKVKFSLPGNAELRNLLGNIYMELGQEEEALTEYQTAVELAPDRSDYRRNLQTIRDRSKNQSP